MNEPSASDLYRDFAKPYLARLLELLRIDRVYARAEGDLLTDTQGNEVLDLLGGYGSTLLGHNHPALVRALTNAYAASVPTHVQGSVRAPAATLARRINDLLHRSFADSPSYLVHFANTGTEAVEAALKHALMEYGARRSAWSTQVDKLLCDLQDLNPSDTRIGQLAAWKATIDQEPPVLLAVQRSYHGKTAGAVSVTWNEGFKSMFDRAPIRTEFLNPDDAEHNRALVARLTHASPLPELPAFCPIVGVVYEPLQSEGGVFPLSAAFVELLHVIRRDLGVPLIADEIQCGFFRTGTFLFSEEIGLRPDYVLLGKSLGGGLAKISALCVSSDRYMQEFSWMHSSTFAEDEPSSIVALRAIEEIESLTPTVEQRARDFEARMRDGVERIRREVGPLIEIRGRGLLLGIDFDLAGEAWEIPLFLKTASDAGLGSYLFMSYFLAQHNIRVGVTLSRPSVIRVEPSLFVSAEAVERFLGALRTLCTLLCDRQVLRVTRHLWNDTFDAATLDAASAPMPKRIAVHVPPLTRIGFMTHVIDVANVRNMDTQFRALSAGERERFMKAFGDVADPVTYHEQVIRSASGREVVVEIYGIMRMTEYFERSMRARDLRALDEVRAGMRIAAKRGASLVGLGQYTSIVSNNGLLVRDFGPAVTTGNSLTAGLAFQTLEQTLAQQGRPLESCRIGIVGAAGNICNVITQLIGDRACALTLVHRDDPDSAVRMQRAKERILAHSSIPESRVVVTTDLGQLVDCDGVVLGTNTTELLIKPWHLKDQAAVIDISVPSNVDPSVFEERPDVTAFHGALAKLPCDQVLATDWMPLPKGQIYACLAETIALGLSGHSGHFSIGTLRKQQVLDALRLAAETGITLGTRVPLKTRAITSDRECRLGAILESAS
jgi:acetylornithine/succinyldiaminopimelate/putrescine aminotransferase/predicted amino acid dehydrogenase